MRTDFAAPSNTGSTLTVTAGQMKGDFPVLTAAQLGGSAAVWSLIPRQEGGWEGRRRRKREETGCSDTKVSQPAWIYGRKWAAIRSVHSG